MEQPILIDQSLSVNTQSTNRAHVGDALDLLYEVLRPYVEREMREVYKDRWLKEARTSLHNKPPDRWDTSDLLSLIYYKYFHVFTDLGHEGRSWVSILKEVRKRWAHQGVLSLNDTRRALETAILLLRAVGATREADYLEPRVIDLMKQELQEKQQGISPPAHSNGSSKEVAAIPAEDKDEEVSEASNGLWEQGVRRVRDMLKRTPVEPLELRRDILDEVERVSEPHKRHFKFNRLIVHLLAENDRSKVLFETALESEGESFSEAVLRRLSDARIPVSGSLHISTKFHRSVSDRTRSYFEKKPIFVELRRRRISTTATLSVIRGKTRRNQFTIKSTNTTNIGRLSDVVDDSGRLVRRNHVAFQDYENPKLSEEQRKIQETVSRVHARIAFDEAEAIFRLYDDQSTCGTSVVREGYLVPIQVRQQSVGLQDGDLIYLGKACLRFTLGRAK